MNQKYFPLLFIAFLSGFSARSQYLPMLSNNHLWSVASIHCLPTGNSYTSAYYQLGTDTILDEKVYSILSYSVDSEMKEWILWGFLREDPDARKIYFRGIYPETEGLIYDFGLQQGDIATILNYYLRDDTIRLPVLSVSEEYFGGKIRKRIELVNTEYEQTEVWYEGIGSLWGLTNSGVAFFSAACGSEELLCFSQGSVTLVQNALYDRCFFGPTGIRDDSQLKDLSLFPNPFHDRLQIQSVNNKPFEIYLLNLHGQILYNNMEVLPGENLSFPEVPAGVYIIKIVQQKQWRYFKAVKN